jgi:hypothetical protein
MVAIFNTEEVTRKYRINVLSQAIFQDLSKISQTIIIILDSFEQAPLEVAEWIRGVFLAEVVNISNIRVVVAGQSVPEPTIEWMADCEYCRLGAIEEVDAWWDFVQNQKLPFPKDVVKAITLTFQGQPKMIVETFSVLAKDWESAATIGKED